MLVEELRRAGGWTLEGVVAFRELREVGPMNEESGLAAVVRKVRQRLLSSISGTRSE
jgi:hypothetical protein